MKIRFQMKHPDIKSAIYQYVDTDNPKEFDRVESILENYFVFGEYLKLELDTDTGVISTVKIG